MFFESSPSKPKIFWLTMGYQLVVDFFTGGGNDLTESDGKTQAHQLVSASWSVQSRHYFHQEGASVTAASYCERAQLLVVGFSSGIFGVYEMPSVSNIHTLSGGSNQIIKTCTVSLTIPEIGWC
jgi:hypothetical protein